MRRTRAYIGIGANVGPAEENLVRAIERLAAIPGARVRAVSPLYATAPVGVVDQPDFLNAVVALDVATGQDPAAGALALLVELKRIERELGRRQRERWGPREVDLDLLVFGRARLALERPPAGKSLDAPVDAGKAARLLEVPHPEAHRRLFVLAPLSDLAPRLVPPGWGETVATARVRQERAEGAAAARRVRAWTGDRWD
jgi:2-amino-4-hydroxy-6-hydroxymethyldihydropteridine diphosphokinase